MIIDPNIASKLKIVTRDTAHEVEFVGDKTIVVGTVPLHVSKMEFASALAYIVNNLPSYDELILKSSEQEVTTDAEGTELGT